MRNILIIVFGFISHFSFGQCTVQGEIPNATVPCNECITLSANGFGENVAAFVENFNSGQPVG